MWKWTLKTSWRLVFTLTCVWFGRMRASQHSFSVRRRSNTWVKTATILQTQLGLFWVHTLVDGWVKGSRDHPHPLWVITSTNYRHNYLPCIKVSAVCACSCVLHACATVLRLIVHLQFLLLLFCLCVTFNACAYLFMHKYASMYERGLWFIGYTLHVYIC